MGCNDVDTCLNRLNCTRLLKGIASRSLPLCSHTSCMSLDKSPALGLRVGGEHSSLPQISLFCRVGLLARQPNTRQSHHPPYGAGGSGQQIRAVTLLVSCQQAGSSLYSVIVNGPQVGQTLDCRIIPFAVLTIQVNRYVFRLACM